MPGEGVAFQAHSLSDHPHKVWAVILRATYRPAGDTTAEPRVLDIERPDYDGAFTVARAETLDGEKLVHVQTLDD